MSELLVGLTGGMGCGKSTAAAYFKALGIDIIDADAIAHQLVKTNTPASREIINHFGHDIRYRNGRLNRSKLRNIIFFDSNAKAWLEALLHPLILNQMKETANQSSSPYCIMVLPLLFEAKLEDVVDRILVINCPLTQQIQHLQKRTRLSEVMINNILSKQVSENYRLTHADDVIQNNQTRQFLKKQIEQWHLFYLQWVNQKEIEKRSRAQESAIEAS